MALIGRRGVCHSQVGGGVSGFDWQMVAQLFLQQSPAVLFLSESLLQKRTEHIRHQRLEDTPISTSTLLQTLLITTSNTNYYKHCQYNFLANPCETNPISFMIVYVINVRYMYIK